MSFNSLTLRAKLPHTAHRALHRSSKSAGFCGWVGVPVSAPSQPKLDEDFVDETSRQLAGRHPRHVRVSSRPLLRLPS